ncbi:MAG TPA: cupin domain-containing protein [Nocardioides sp.]|nr:cupin domain-containing protein [Nocardioides sp.]
MVKPVSAEPGQRARIGARLRAARVRQGLTLDNVAGAAGVTKGFLSRLERDETSPSVATLQVICEVLSLPIGSLFEAPEHDVVRAEEAPGILLVGDGVDERLLTPRGQPQLQVVRSTVEAGGSGGDHLYTLDCDVEVVHVLKGRIEVVMVDTTVHLGAGDTLTFKGREPHTWRNLDEKRPAELMWIIAPAAWG